MHKVEEEAVDEVGSSEETELLDMFNIRSEPPCISREKFEFRSIQVEVDELTHLLAFCYDTWWRRMAPSEESLPDRLASADEPLRVESFACYYCGRYFECRTRLKSHFRKRHRQLYKCYDTWWRRMAPSEESLPNRLASADEPLRVESFSCYYCGRDFECRTRLKSHFRKRHRQLYKCLPVVLLERINVEREKLYTQSVSSSYSSSEVCRDVEARRHVYHCADCAHSSISRQKIKVHIFTRHIFKKLYVKYSLKHFGVSRYFIGVKQNMSKMDEKSCHPPFHYHGLPLVKLERCLVKNESQDAMFYTGSDCWIKEERNEDEMSGSGNVGNFTCSYCFECLTSSTDLGGHIATTHGNILKYFPFVRLERVLIENDRRELFPHIQYPNLNLPEEKLARPSLEDMKADLGYYTQPSNCGSSVDEGSSTYSRLGSTPIRSVGAQRRVYRCSECVYSARSRVEIKVHIFTRHIYRFLYFSRRERLLKEPFFRVTAQAVSTSRLPFVKLERLSTKEIQTRLAAASAISSASEEDINTK